VHRPYSLPPSARGGRASRASHVHGLADGRAAAQLARLELAPGALEHIECDVRNDRLVGPAAALTHLRATRAAS